MPTSPAPTLQESLADYVKRIRMDLQMSQLELAAASGIHPHSLGKIERGKTTRLNRKTLQGLAMALSIPQEYLEAICKGEEVKVIVAVKFCPQCWTPGTGADPMWTDVRAKYCFMCGTPLRSHCANCGELVASLKYRFCPFCGFAYKNS
ncbi:double zinc ribbon domain-containing protein [Fischerella sp. PCC 9605]|uniref:double zinc ribbon domain-containing protein n=1 Tax=Fischerella sp. PCC 9605 TaxID=1173024 RepID=UPI00047AF6EA|nr:zinc ribbon domain-containing protein [Fischerella sp. PCC 9605]